MPNIESSAPFLLAMGFLVYFCIHSVLASLWAKKYVARRCPSFMPAYRITFNIAAIILLLPLVWVMRHFPGPLLWHWQGYWSWAMNILGAVAVAGFILALKGYDGAEFIGIRQWRKRELSINDQEQFHISTLHRFVRHPWYFLLLVMLWTRDIHLAQLIVYSLVTLYFVIGSRLEEQKLVQYHGEAYHRYRKLVPGLVPLPWHYLNRKTATELVQLARQQRGPK